MKQTLINGDCITEMEKLPPASIDLIIADPPYNIGKADWDRVDDYIGWCVQWLARCRRLLKDSGSLYVFHNDMPVISRLMCAAEDNTDLIFRQFIVWNKRYDGARNKGFLDGFVVPAGLRNYQKMAEYILFYTLQDDTGLTAVKLDINNFASLRQYFKDYQEALGMTLPEINRALGHRRAEHAFYWGSTQWDMPTEETYAELGKLPVGHQFVCREYEDLRREYEDLRREYEDLRYTFNNLGTHHSVWNYGIAERNGHETPKPLPLLENIIKHSSNKGDVVLDPFMGSGSVGVACKRLERDYVGIEISADYCELAHKRMVQAIQMDLALKGVTAE